MLPVPQNLRPAIAAELPAAGALLSATDDPSAIRSWLDRLARSQHTLMAYEREAERLLIWLRYRGLRLCQMTLEDATSYRKFLCNPPAEWIGPKRPRTAPDWRPFAGPLSPTSVKFAVTTVKRLYAFLNDARYLTGNPFALLPSESIAEAPFERYLDHELWDRLFNFVCDLPKHTESELQHAVRCRWLFALLYLTGARRQEVAQAKMRDFIIRDGQWWLRVNGKGNKIADIPAPDRLLEELDRYRQAIGLIGRPALGDETPLVGRLRQRKDRKTAKVIEHTSLTAKAIHLIVKTVFLRFADSLKESGEVHLAKEVAAMSAHWLRHTSASHQLQSGVPLLHVSQNLRHNKIETTKLYLHTEKKERHEMTRSFGSTPKTD